MRIYTKAAFFTGLALVMALQAYNSTASPAKYIEQGDTSTVKLSFVITYTVGNAMGSVETTILGVAVADSAVNAVKPYIQPANENWKVHKDTKTRYYVRVENPVSFISSMIEHYAATAGEAIKNKEGLMKFKILIHNEDSPFNTTTEELAEIWAKNAEKAIRQYFEDDKESCGISESTNSIYYVSAAGPAGIEKPMQYYTATAVFNYMAGNDL